MSLKPPSDCVIANAEGPFRLRPSVEIALTSTSSCYLEYFLICGTALDLQL